MLEKLKKHGWVLHVVFVTGVYLYYFSYPPYGTPHKIAGYIPVLGCPYSIAGVLILKNHILKPKKTSWEKGTFFLILGTLLFLVEIVRTAGH